MEYTRRDVVKLALASLATGSFGTKSHQAYAQSAARPNSRFAGVEIGINAPISFRGTASTADEIIIAMTKLGLSACELRLQPVEGFIRGTGASPVANAAGGRGGQRAGAQEAASAGAPNRTANPGAAGARGGAGGGGRAPLTAEQEAAQKAAAEELRKWRLSLSEDVFRAFRKKYEDAGIRIRVLKVDNIDTFADDVVDYSFNVARLLGAEALSTEVPLSASKRIGQFAEKHQMLVGYHGHTDINNPEAFGSPQSWETAMSYSRYNGWNLDLGHFLAATNLSPVPFLEKYHDRITHLHLKDRKKNMGPNVPWGQGDTPVAETLQLLRDRKWDILCAIEMEHPNPPGSDPMTELGKCIEFCKQALISKG